MWQTVIPDTFGTCASCNDGAIGPDGVRAKVKADAVGSDGIRKRADECGENADACGDGG